MSASVPSLVVAASSPVLVLTVGASVMHTLVETAQREGLDVNSLATGLLMLGLGKQSAFVMRQSRVVADDAPNTLVSVVCMACGRARADVQQRCCSTCGGSWTTRLD